MKLVLVIVEKALPNEKKLNTYILIKKHNLLSKKTQQKHAYQINKHVKHKISLSVTMHCCLKNHFLFNLLLQLKQQVFYKYEENFEDPLYSKTKAT